MLLVEAKLEDDLKVVGNLEELMARLDQSKAAGRLEPCKFYAAHLSTPSEWVYKERWRQWRPLET